MHAASRHSAMDPDLTAWVDQVLGHWVLDRGDGPWRVRTARGAFWVKQLPRGRAWAQVERVHREVLPALSGVPQRVAVCASLRATLLTEVPGRPLADDAPLPHWEALGRAVGALHAIPCPDPDPISLDAALRLRAEAAIARAPWASELMRLVEAMPTGRQRTWCHRDLRPANVLVGARIGLIDFEHARPDDPLVDLMRLEAGGWTADRRRAFLKGWDHSPEPAALRAHLGLYGVLTWLWASTHDDTTFMPLGRRALQRAGLPEPPPLA